MDSSRTRRSTLIRSSSRGQLGNFSRVLRPLPPKNPDDSQLAAARNAESLEGREGEPVQPSSSRRGILEISDSPPRSPAMGDSASKKKEKFGGFLEACSFCQNKLKPTDDLYMYSYLGAFCSPDCREDMMSADGFHDEYISEFPMFRLPWTPSMLLTARDKLLDSEPRLINHSNSDSDSYSDSNYDSYSDYDSES